MRAIVTILTISAASVAAMGPPYNPADWTLDFEDEFDSFNTSLWKPLNGTHGPTEGEFYLPKNCGVQDGKLVLTSLKETAYDHNYTSCWVDTSESFAAREGRFEFNAMLPYGKGMWPALWMMPYNGFCWPMGGEIDVMENIGQMNEVHAALHWSDYTVGPCPCYDHEQSNQNFSLPLPAGAPLFNETYTTFGVEWDKDAMVFYYNSTAYLTVPDPTAKFQQTPFYYIINTAVGGSWPGFPDDSTVFPQYHRVDWVRHYSSKTAA